MVDADDHGGATFIMLDQPQLPERARLIQLLGSKFRNIALQLLLIALAGQAHASDVPLPVEMGVLDPPIFSTAYLHPLPEARYRQETCGQVLPKPIQLHRAFQNQNADDDHWVRWPVHTEPGRVYRR